jgi:transposase-like protein
VDPTTAFCPNLACPARGQASKGNISLHSQKERRFICKQCGKTFAENKGTAFYRLHTSAETVTLVVTLLAHGCPVQAIVAAFGFDERTVADWLDRAGTHCQAVHEHLVEKPRRLGQVQADELRVKIQARILWMAMALVVSSRLWLGGEVSQTRDLPLIRELMRRVRRCALAGRILISTDGLCAYVRASREAFRNPLAASGPGRKRLRIWGRLLIAQVVKRYEQRRVVEIERHVRHGNPEQVEKARAASSGEGVINTAYIERLNGTFRERLAEPGAQNARAGSDRHETGSGDVAGRDGLELLHPAREPARDGGPNRARSLARDGGRHHAPLLECSRAVGLPRCASPMGAAQTARPTLA